MKKWFIVIALFFLVSCSAQEHPYEENLKAPHFLSTATLSIGDSYTFHFQKWPAQGEEKAVIIAVHGFNDYSKSFESPARILNEQGITVYAYDQRGFGHNRQAGIWPGSHNLTRDLWQISNLIHHHHKQKPLYWLGESMGGAVIISALAEKQALDHTYPHSIILTGPALWGAQTMTPFHKFIIPLSLNFFSHLSPSWRLKGQGLKIVPCNNKEVLQQMATDPYVIKGSRVDTLKGLMQLMTQTFENLKKLEKPTLIMYGLKDQVIPKKALEYSLDQLKNKKNLKWDCVFYKDSYHMMLRDYEGKMVTQHISEWILYQNLPKPSPQIQLIHKKD
jgi:acylglycerol lipase